MVSEQLVLCLNVSSEFEPRLTIHSFNQFSSLIFIKLDSSNHSMMNFEKKTETLCVAFNCIFLRHFDKGAMQVYKAGKYTQIVLHETNFFLDNILLITVL